MRDPPGHTQHLAVTLHHDSQPDLDSPGLAQPSPTHHAIFRGKICIIMAIIAIITIMAIISDAPYLFMILSVNILQ